jgi:hypothetical protein
VSWAGRAAWPQHRRHRDGPEAATGDDLSRLLIGLAHAGQLTAAELGHIREVVIDGYLEGLAQEASPAAAVGVIRAVAAIADRLT